MNEIGPRTRSMLLDLLGKYPGFVEELMRIAAEGGTVSNAAQPRLFFKIKTNTGNIGEDYTGEIWSNPYGTAAMSAGKYASNEWERHTDAKYVASIGGLQRLPVDVWYPIHGTYVDDGRVKFLLHERNEPECP